MNKTFFAQTPAGTMNVQRTVYLDELRWVTSDPTPPVTPGGVHAMAGERHVDLGWDLPTPADVESYRIERLSERRVDAVDVGERRGRRRGALGRAPRRWPARCARSPRTGASASRRRPPSSRATTASLGDQAFLDMIQRSTFRYFWQSAHPVSGLTRERSSSGDICASGGTGFGIMAIPVGHRTRLHHARRGRGARAASAHVSRDHGRAALGGVPALDPRRHRAARRASSARATTRWTWSRPRTSRRGCSRCAGTSTAPGRTRRRSARSPRNCGRRSSGTPSRAPGEDRAALAPLAHHGAVDRQRLGLERVHDHLPARRWPRPRTRCRPSFYHPGWARNGAHGARTRATMAIRSRWATPTAGRCSSPTTRSWASTRASSATPTPTTTRTTATTRWCRWPTGAANPLGRTGYSALALGAHGERRPVRLQRARRVLERQRHPHARVRRSSSMPYVPAAVARRGAPLLRRPTAPPCGDTRASGTPSTPGSGWTASDYIAIDQGPIVLMIENSRSALLWDHFMANPEIAPMLDGARVRARCGPAVGGRAGVRHAAARAAPGGVRPTRRRARCRSRSSCPSRARPSVEVFDLTGRRVAATRHRAAGRRAPRARLGRPRNGRRPGGTGGVPGARARG